MPRWPAIPTWGAGWSRVMARRGPPAPSGALWPRAKRAYDGARGTDADGAGVMATAKAGAGAIEGGDLQRGRQSDVYMSAVWVNALDEPPDMARAMGDRAAATDAQSLHA